MNKGYNDGVPIIPRIVNLPELLNKKSHFLLGPRQTGKSFLIEQQLDNAVVYDLLDGAVFIDLSQRPGRLYEEIADDCKLVVIDEIQRLPELLNEVHRLITKKGVRFLLTGSSARKLRRGGVNLLGGRARIKHLNPLCRFELKNHFDLNRAIRCGLLPSIYFSDDPEADLRAYTGLYLQQEIVAEGAARNLTAFTRFLYSAASCNASIVNFTKLASDAQVPRTTVYEYFEILKDTLILHEVPAWGKSKKRKPIVSSKYYFFDVGVVSSLQGRSPTPGTPEFGLAFETWLHHELRCWCDYYSGENIRFWRSTSGFEVDFILDDHTVIEIKAKTNVASHDLKSLHAIREEQIFKRYICVSMEKRARQVGHIRILPYQEFLQRLWSGEFTG